MNLTSTVNLLGEVAESCRGFDSSSAIDRIHKSYCYGQLNYMRRIANAITTLDRTDSYHAISILARSVLESYFKFHGAVASQENCIRAIFTDADDDVNRTRKLIDEDSDPDPRMADLLESKTAERDYIRSLQANIRRIDLYTFTPDGDLKVVYRMTYHPLSQASHGNYLVTASCDEGGPAVDRVATVCRLIWHSIEVAIRFFALSDQESIRQRLESLSDNQ